MARYGIKSCESCGVRVEIQIKRDLWRKRFCGRHCSSLAAAHTPVRSPTFSKWRSQKNRELWQDPKERKSRSRAMADAWTPERRIAQGKRTAQMLAERKIDRKPTNLEHALELLLQEAGLDYEANKYMSNRVVDFWVASRGLVFEADGQYWHQDKEKETLRDKQLVRAGAVAIVHLDDDDLAPWTEV